MEGWKVTLSNLPTFVHVLSAPSIAAATPGQQVRAGVHTEAVGGANAPETVLDHLARRVGRADDLNHGASSVGQAPQSNHVASEGSARLIEENLAALHERQQRGFAHRDLLCMGVK